MKKVVGEKYRLGKKIGAGSFGQIYTGEDINTHEKVSIKVEPCNCKVPQLSYESKLYMLFSGCTNVPKFYWFGVEDDNNYMVIDLLDKSLEDLLHICGGRMSLKTVLMLIDQMISSVEYLHNKNFVHRDIKPDNFLMGRKENANQVYIIDFGLSKSFCDTITHNHIPFSDGKSLTGTARYASVNALRGVEPSRRDDMESLGYVWIYLLKGNLPWMGLDAKDRKTKYDRICQVKANTSLEELCGEFPEEFTNYFNSVKSLRFAETPNYALYKKMFRCLFQKLGYEYDYKYDWSNPLKVPRSLPKPSAPQGEDEEIPKTQKVKIPKNMIVGSIPKPVKTKKSSVRPEHGSIALDSSSGSLGKPAAPPRRKLSQPASLNTTSALASARRKSNAGLGKEIPHPVKRQNSSNYLIPPARQTNTSALAATKTGIGQLPKWMLDRSNRK